MHKGLLRHGLLVFAGVALAGACGGSGAKHGVECDRPGLSEPCSCPGLPEGGTWTCQEDGYWSECDCDTPYVEDGTGGNGSGGDGAGDESGGEGGTRTGGSGGTETGGSAGAAPGVGGAEAGGTAGVVVGTGGVTVGTGGVIVSTGGSAGEDTGGSAGEGTGGSAGEGTGGSAGDGTGGAGGDGTGGAAGDGTGGISAGTGGDGTGGDVVGSGGAGTGGDGTAGAGTGGDGTAGAGTGGDGTAGAGTGGATGVECTLPDLPDSVSSLPRIETLPDPFTFFDGTPVTTKADWECRRREIQAIAAKYIYGPYPFEPDETTGTVSGGNISITCTEGSNTENFTATISGSGDVITVDMGSGILPSSRKSLSFGSGFEGKIRNLFGLSEMNTNVATGWMVDRVIEVLEQNPGSGHDPTKMAVSGCSGCGKGAFLVGVFSRVPMTIVVESGGGGASNLRQAEWFRHGAGYSTWQCVDALPQSIDNLEDDGICGPWVTSAASPLRSNPDLVNHLPIDQHCLLATIAPRYLVHFTNNNGVNSWCHLGGTCEALTAWAAEPVWNALGVPERMGFLMYSAQHCSAPSEATSLAQEFFSRAFEGDTSASTDVMDIMPNGVQQPVSEWESMWVDWDMGKVLQ